MKKICTLLATVFIMVLTFAMTVSAEDETAPAIASNGASIRISDETEKCGLRFKMKVDTPFTDGVEVIEQGALIIPSYVIGENELTINTDSVLKVVKSEKKYYSCHDDYYEFTAVLTDIPICNLMSTICARGYLTYTVNGGEEKTTYSDTVIYDIYSVAEKVLASETEKDETKVAVNEFILNPYNTYVNIDGGNEEGLLTITSPTVGETVYPYREAAKNYLLAVEEYEDEIDVASGSYVDVNAYRKYKFDSVEPISMWMAGDEITAELTNVRFYDRNGNDLGVRTSRSTGMSVSKNVNYTKNKNLDHTYTVSVEKGHAIALCTNKETTANKVFMEYTVKSSSGNAMQSGGMITMDPSKYYPYSGGNGFMIYEHTSAKESPLLQAGAEYIICMEKYEKSMDVTVQKTYKGKKTIFTFPMEVGDYITKFNYFGLWLHEANEETLNFELVDVKVYDSNNNNLGLRANRGSVKFTHSGEIEDYSGCEAVYHCEKDHSMVALYQDQTMKFTKDGVTKNGFYSISDSGDRVITLSYEDGKDSYSYLYKRFVNDEGKEYRRLGSYKVFLKDLKKYIRNIMYISMHSQMIHL